MQPFTPQPNRDAYATIRGFAYQVDPTIDRWFSLREGEVLGNRSQNRSSRGGGKLGWFGVWEATLRNNRMGFPARCGRMPASSRGSGWSSRPGGWG